MTSTPSTGSPLLPVLPVLPVAPQGASWSRKRFPRWQQALDGKACKGGGIPLSLVVPLTWDGGNECDAHLCRGRAVRHVSCNLCKRLCNVTVKFCSSLRPPLTSVSQTTVGDSLTPIRVPPPDVPGSRSRRDGKTALPIVAGASWAFLHREDALQTHREQRLPRFGDPGPGTQHRAGASQTRTSQWGFWEGASPQRQLPP